MANGRHSYVAFYPSDWLAGVARMSRKHRSVYFDVCCYNWDQNRPCPEAHLAVMLGDMKDWRVIVDELVAIGKLERGCSRSSGERKGIRSLATQKRRRAETLS
jgi:hypothetical protein